MKQAALIGWLVSLLAFAAPAHAQEAPDALVKRVATEVMDIIKKDKDIQAGHKQKVLDLVEAKVFPHFNFERMAQFATGKYWRNATPEQKKALTAEFKTTLVRTYSNSLSAYKGQTVDYPAARFNPADAEVTVKTVVNQPGGAPIPIDYSMEKTAAGWKVYDVSVDGISLLTNYRNSFNSQIRQSGIDGLIKALGDKNRDPSGKS